jgi:uncharacterized Tic20 family protein
VLSHVGMFILAVILPLIFRQTEGKTNRYVRHHATESLNFQLTFLIVWIGGIITVVAITASTSDSNGDNSGWIVLPFLVLFALYGACAVLAIIGAVRAGQRRWWRDPIRIPFVRGTGRAGGSSMQVLEQPLSGVAHPLLLVGVRDVPGVVSEACEPVLDDRVREGRVLEARAPCEVVVDQGNDEVDVRVAGHEQRESLGLGDRVVGAGDELVGFDTEHAGEQADRSFAGHRDPGFEVRERGARHGDARAELLLRQCCCHAVLTDPAPEGLHVRRPRTDAHENDRTAKRPRLLLGHGAAQPARWAYTRRHDHTEASPHHGHHRPGRQLPRRAAPRQGL